MDGVDVALAAQDLRVRAAELGFVEVLAEALLRLGDVLVDFGLNLGDVLLDQDVGAVALLAVLVVNERVVEGVDVAGSLPRRGVHENRGVDAHDVLVHADHGCPPVLLDVVLQLAAELPVIVGGAQSIVNLAAGKDKPVLFRVADDFLQSVFAHVFVCFEEAKRLRGCALRARRYAAGRTPQVLFLLHLRP